MSPALSIFCSSIESMCQQKKENGWPELSKQRVYVTLTFIYWGQRDRRQRAPLQHQNIHSLFYLGWFGQVLNHPYVTIITNAGSSNILVYSVVGKQLFFTKEPELNQTEIKTYHHFCTNNTESCICYLCS